MVKKLSILCILVFLTSFTIFSYNYGEVLQKAIYFYECQQAGPLPSWNRVKWRGDATMQDEVTGGWYDAGDHVKFNFPMAYSAAMLGWAIFEYESAISSVGQLTHLKRNIQFTLDYLAACWDGSRFIYMIGDGDDDHGWWGPVEVIHKEVVAGNRPAISVTSNCSAVMAQTAAALTIGYLIFNNTTYLNKAEQLFEKADDDKSDANYTEAYDFYRSWSGFYDELLWAAVWLYIATNDNSYITKAESYIPLVRRQEGTGIDEPRYDWAHCWDEVHHGAFLLLARITNNKEHRTLAHKNLDFWINGAKGFTPKGLSWLDRWGALRYASSAAFLAFVYSDWTGADSARASSYKSWAESQIYYMLGDNERNGSYVIGFGQNSPEHPHHRTSHGSWVDLKSIPTNHRHILYGALVGGPLQDGTYTDDITDYQANEVACDYNAGFICAISKMIDLYGGTSISNFPPQEQKEDEFFIEASLNTSAETYTEIKALCNNRSGWPARLIKDLRFRYFMDLSEIFNAGYTVNDLDISTQFVEYPVNISPITLWNGSVYYIEISFQDGTDIYPGGQSEFAGEVQFRISVPTATSFWNPSNDFSYQDISCGNEVKTLYIPVYNGSTKIFGEEPFGGTTIRYGDVNVDDIVGILDALLISQFYVNLNPVNFIYENADVNLDGAVNIIDALIVARYYVGLIEILPYI